MTPSPASFTFGRNDSLSHGHSREKDKPSPGVRNALRRLGFSAREPPPGASSARGPQRPQGRAARPALGPAGRSPGAPGAALRDARWPAPAPGAPSRWGAGVGRLSSAPPPALPRARLGLPALPEVSRNEKRNPGSQTQRASPSPRVRRRLICTDQRTLEGTGPRLVPGTGFTREVNGPGLAMLPGS